MFTPTRVHRFMIQDPIDSVNRDIGDLVDRFFNPGPTAAASATYAADVREDGDHFYVDVELPGFRKEDVEVTLEKSTLSVKAVRKPQAQAEPVNGAGPAADEQSASSPHQVTDTAATVAQAPRFRLRERQMAGYQRMFKLPPTVSDGNVDAKLVDGVLLITLDKREEAKPRKIAVK